jgi:hypothetical protein
MNLTIAKIRAFTKRALRDNNIAAEIESIEWVGKRSKPKFGNIEFRVARVILKASDGRRVFKSASIDTTNAFEIK